MKKLKSILLPILGVLMLTAGYMYRKYKRAERRQQKLEIQRSHANQALEFQMEQEKIARQKEYDSIQALELKKSKARYDEVKESSKKLQETMKMLEEEAKKQKE